MKKYWIIAAVLLFSAFVYLGIRLTDAYLLPVINEPPDERKPASLNYQRSVLMVQIDDMTATNPQLISMWILFISNTDTSQVIIKSIFTPIVEDPQSTQLAVDFNITQDNNLSSTFLHTVGKQNIPYNNIILFDQSAFKSISEWITAHSVSLSPIIAKSMDDAQNILVQDAAVFNEICRSIPGKSQSRGPVPPWENLVTSHFSSDFLFDDMMLLWEVLSNNEHSIQCEVIASQ